MYGASMRYVNRKMMGPIIDFYKCATWGEEKPQIIYFHENYTGLMLYIITRAYKLNCGVFVGLIWDCWLKKLRIPYKCKAYVLFRWGLFYVHIKCG